MLSSPRKKEFLKSVQKQRSYDWKTALHGQNRSNFTKIKITEWLLIRLSKFPFPMLTCSAFQSMFCIISIFSRTREISSQSDRELINHDPVVCAESFVPSHTGSYYDDDYVMMTNFSVTIWRLRSVDYHSAYYDEFNRSELIQSLLQPHTTRRIDFVFVNNDH